MIVNSVVMLSGNIKQQRRRRRRLQQRWPTDRTAGRVVRPRSLYGSPGIVRFDGGVRLDSGNIDDRLLTSSVPPPRKHHAVVIYSYYHNTQVRTVIMSIFIRQRQRYKVMQYNMKCNTV